MKHFEFQQFHEREAARLWRLIADATTPAIKARLTKQAEGHETLADGVEDAAAMAEASSRLAMPLG